jgi:hypothetical protein
MPKDVQNLNRLRPDEYFVIVRRISNKHCQDDAGACTLNGWYFVDTARVEKVEVALLKIDLIILDSIFSSVPVKRFFGDMRLDVLRPEAPM